MNESPKPPVLPILVALVALALSACSSEEPPLQGAAIGGPFALTDQDGRRVTDRDFAGRYRIMYFGFTHCPDVCPTDLAVIGQALRRFEKSDPKRAARVVPVFVSVDPALLQFGVAVAEQSQQLHPAHLEILQVAAVVQIPHAVDFRVAHANRDRLLEQARHDCTIYPMTWPVATCDCTGRDNR